MGKMPVFVWSGMFAATVALTGCQSQSGSNFSGTFQDKNTTVAASGSTAPSNTYNRPTTLPAQATTTSASLNTSSYGGNANLSATTNGGANAFSAGAAVQPTGYQQSMGAQSMPQGGTMVSTPAQMPATYSQQPQASGGVSYSNTYSAPAGNGMGGNTATTNVNGYYSSH